MLMLNGESSTSVSFLLNPIVFPGISTEMSNVSGRSSEGDFNTRVIFTHDSGQHLKMGLEMVMGSS